MGQAVTFTGAGRAELTDVEDGTVGAAEVAGSTLISLISPGTEIASYTADPGSNHVIPGYAAVFRIEEVGNDVNDLEVGQLVYCMGKHRSRQCHAADMVLPLPPGLDPAVAVFARMAGVSMTTLTTTAARPPGPVLVTGLGLVGNLAAQAFQAAGYQVVAHDPVASRVEVARQSGIADARTELGDDPEATYSLVVECSGHEDAALAGCRLVEPGGEVVLVGAPWRKRGTNDAHTLVKEIFFRYAHLRSGWEWELPTKAEPWRRGSVLGNQATALRWLAQEGLRVQGLAVEMSPGEAQDAYQGVLHQEGPLSRLFRWSST